MVTSTGTFVSCKDYDDEIDGLNSRVDGVESQIKDLEAKINAAKWITNVTPATGGFTVAFSDGSSYTITNGKDGAVGEAGAPGTEWTISEDGFWVCNGEKTTVKAVGQDGAKGEDAQPEVKKENGKWYLWNGTEFEEFAGSAAPATNVPYYYVDPNDANYTVLVICDKDGKNEKEIRLPMTSGLAQLTVLNSDLSQGSVNMTVNYALRKASTEWDGKRELPAIGEYMVGTDVETILVQVTPSNYDLAALDLKFVNGKGEEVPVTLGKAVPATLSRAVSATGVYEIPVTVNPIKENAELVEYYQSGQPLSLVANESVRSTYTSQLTMTKSSTTIGANAYMSYLWNSQSQMMEWVNRYATIAGKALLVTPRNDNAQASKIYDSYLTIKDDQTNKAKAIKYGISVDGMTVNSAENAEGQYIILVAHYVDVIGKVYKQEITISFNGEYVEPETIDLTASKHTIAFIKAVNSPSLTANFDEYFKNIQGDDRIVWNSEHQIYAYMYNPSNQYRVQYSYTDPEDYSTHTGYLYGFVTAIAANEDGASLNTETGLAKFKNLKLSLDYSKTANVNGVDLFDYDVTYTLQVVVSNKVTGSNDYVNVPFTVEQPSADEIAKQYAFDAIAYDKTTNAFTVFGTTATLSDLIKASSKGTENGATIVLTGTKKPNNVTTTDYEVANSVVTLKNTNKYGTAYAVTGAKVSYRGHEFEIPTFNVIFKKSATEATYTFSLSNEISVVRGGSTVAVKVGDLTTADKATYAAGLNILDAAGNKLKDVTITAVEYDNTYFTVTIPTGGKSLSVAPVNKQIAKDTSFTMKITFTYDNGSGKTEAGTFVKVMAI